MKIIYSFFLFALLTFTSLAQIPSGYYDNAAGLSGEQLKTALFEIINDHNAQSYNSIWTHFQSTDPKPNGKVWDMYSDVPNGTPPYEYTFGGDQCGNYTQEGDCYNREHSFPKSWFDDDFPMSTDLFHIVPTDGYVNQKRSNWPFGETNNPTWISMNGSKVGTNSTSGYSGTIFEPIDAYKGDFARAYFYMATRYEDVIASWENYDSNGDAVLDGTSYPVFEDWCLDLLMDWNSSDPVSQKEIDRNNAIYNIQDNRNPFIDHPEWVNSVWNTNQAPVITNVSFTPQSPDENQLVVVSAVITDDVGINEAFLNWGYSGSTLNNQLVMSNSGSTYSAQIPGQAAGQTVYFQIEAIDNESASSQSAVYQYTVNGNVNEPPVITNIVFSPENPSSNQEVTVTAIITDDEAVDQAQLLWGFSSSTLNNTVQMNASGNTYAAIIPGQNENISVYFKIQAFDGENAMTESSVYQYTVLSNPNEPPLISNIEYTPSSPSAGEEVVISAVITDDDGVALAQVLWGYSSANLNSILPMNANADLYSASIPGQTEGISVYFKIRAFDEENLMSETNIYQFTVDNNSGTISLPFIENFENEDLGIFNAISISGTSEVWFNNNDDDNLFAEMSNFNGSQFIENEDWLISPAINFDMYSDEVLHFRSAMNGSNDNDTFLYLKISTNYNGVSDPYTATWTDITSSASWSVGDFSWTSSGEIDLSEINGTAVYLAFKYVSEQGSGKTWRIDNISITLDGMTNTPPVISNIQINPEYPNNEDEVHVSAIITDDDLVMSAILYYGESEDFLSNVIPMQENANVYSATITPQEAFTTIYYKIEARDSDNELSESPVFSYYVDLVDLTEANNREDGYRIYPNPASKQIKFKTDNNVKSLEIKVYDLAGKLLMNKTLESNTCLDLSQLSPEVYIVQIDDGKLIEIKQIVIY